MTAPTQVVHESAIALSAHGFWAFCACGWRSPTHWDRGEVARLRGEHRRWVRAQEAS